MAVPLTETDKLILLGAFGTPETTNRVIGLLNAAGTGNVTGPGTSTDKALPRFSGTTGDLLQDSGVILSNLNALSGISSLALSSFEQFTQIATPSNPPASNNKLYFKSDNNLYKLTSAGIETQIAPIASPTFTGTVTAPLLKAPLTIGVTPITVSASPYYTGVSIITSPTVGDPAHVPFMGNADAGGGFGAFFGYLTTFNSTSSNPGNVSWAQDASHGGDGGMRFQQFTTGPIAFSVPLNFGGDHHVYLGDFGTVTNLLWDIDGNGNIGSATQRPLDVYTKRKFIFGTELVPISNPTTSSIFIGAYPGALTGIGNTTLGSLAGSSLTSGTNNLYVGTSAGLNAIISSNNTAVGSESGELENGGQNTFLGYRAGKASSGSQNVIIGAHAGEATGASTGSVYIGGFSGVVATGDRNTFTGFANGQLATGSDNSFYGYSAATDITSGAKNSILGSNAGLSLTSGSSNIILGNAADVSSPTASNEWQIGSTSAPINDMYVHDSGSGLTFHNSKVKFTGDVTVNTAGKGLQIKEGSNAKLGVSTLVAGTVTVSNTSVTANSRIFLTKQDSGTPVALGAIRVSARSVGTSFTITSDNVLDTSDIAWNIIEAL